MLSGTTWVPPGIKLKPAFLHRGIRILAAPPLRREAVVISVVSLKRLFRSARTICGCDPPRFLYFLLFGQFSRGSVVENDIMTIREVSELLKINEKTAYRLAAEGKLPGFKVGGSWRFERQEISNWIRRQMEGQRGGSQE